MIQKLTIALFTSSVSAIYLDKRMVLKNFLKLDETCDANTKRIENSKEFSGHDESFPASKYSLFWNDHNRSDDMKKTYEKVDTWTTPKELLSGKTPNLWGEKGVLPAGVKQGELGDCWFLASASAIAEYPERIHQIFKNKEYPENGVFQLRFYNRGKPTNIWIDDRLPLNEDGKLVNSKMSINKAWWLPILEKAYAKFNINYSTLNGGNPGQALRELTGMPVSMYDSKKQSEKEFFDIV